MNARLPSRRDMLKLSLGAGAAALFGTGLGHASKPKPRGTADGSKRLLILGGTNFLGPALVEVARRQNWTLTLFNRGKTNPQLFPDLEQLHGDRRVDLSALKGRTWDAVIDTSGYHPKDVAASARLLSGAIGHYVFISTISAYRESRRPVDESSPLADLKKEHAEHLEHPEKATPESYGPLKVLCEQAAEKAMPNRTTVIRSGLIAGPGDPTDRFTYWPVRVAHGGEVLCPGTPSDPVQFIDVRDLAEWTIQAVAKNVLGVHNAVGPKNPSTMNDLIGACHRLTGAESRLVWVPGNFLMDRKVSPWSDMPVWISPDGDEAGLVQVSNRRAVAAGLSFRSVEETARDTLTWWRTLPAERRAARRAGISPEREIQVLAKWFEYEAEGGKLVGEHPGHGSKPNSDKSQSEHSSGPEKKD